MRNIIILCVCLFSMNSHAEKFIAISKHMLLTDEGNVYSIDTGFEENGSWEKLGKEFYLGRKEGPLIGKVEFLKDIKKIIVANSSFLVLTKKGEVFTWGLNEEKWIVASSLLCGGFLGKSKPLIRKPEKLLFDNQKIKDVIYHPCGTMSALTESGGLYMWGWYWSYYKQDDKSKQRAFDLQPVESIDKKSIPKKIPTNKNIVSASSDVLITDEGSILFFGKGYTAKRMSNFLTPCGNYLCEVAISNARSVSAFSEIMMENGDLYYPEWDIVEEGKVSRKCIKYFDNHSYVTCDGDIYRAGLFSNHSSWIASMVSDYSKDFERIYRKKDIVDYHRDAFVTNNGEIFVYGYDMLGDFMPLYRKVISENYPKFDFDDPDELKQFYKVADSEQLNISVSP